MDGRNGDCSAANCNFDVYGGNLSVLITSHSDGETFYLLFAGLIVIMAIITAVLVKKKCG